MEWWDYDLLYPEELEKVKRAEKARTARIMASKTGGGKGPGVSDAERLDLDAVYSR